MLWAGKSGRSLQRATHGRESTCLLLQVHVAKEGSFVLLQSGL